VTSSLTHSPTSRTLSSLAVNRTCRETVVLLKDQLTEGSEEASEEVIEESEGSEEASVKVTEEAEGPEEASVEVIEEAEGSEEASEGGSEDRDRGSKESEGLEEESQDQEVKSQDEDMELPPFVYATGSVDCRIPAQKSMLYYCMLLAEGNLPVLDILSSCHEVAWIQNINSFVVTRPCLWEGRAEIYTQ